MDEDELTFRERLADRYDSFADWVGEQTQGFDFSNFADMRNLWALFIGSFCLVAIPLGLLGVFAGLPEGVGGVIFWPAWVIVFAVGALAIGKVGVAKCAQCGARLKAGYYTCRRCGSTSKPRGIR